MDRREQPPKDSIVRLADLEWLDLSDLIRMDEEWRLTLVAVSRLHLAVSAVLALIVIGYVWFAASSLGPLEMVVMGGILLCVGGMAFLVASSKNDPTRLLANLRIVVLLSILATSLMVYSLRELQGDYYLLYLLPLVSAAGYLGFAGGLLAGVASALAYAVVFLLSPVFLTPGSLSALLLRTLVLVLVASLLGLISERHLSLLNAMRSSHTQAIQLAVTDSRTGLFNAAYLQSRLKSEISRAERSKTPLAFLVLDVDDLGRINEKYGYDTGDSVLQTIGRIIQKQLRASDIPGRWGVDEFGVLLFNSDPTGAETVARRILAQVADHPFTGSAGGKEFRVAVAAGIAAFPAHTQDKTGSELVERAYHALGQAKAANSIVVWS